MSFSQIWLAGSFPSGLLLQVRGGLSNPVRKSPLLPCIKCNKKDDPFEHVSVERPPYDSYMDSTSGQLEPASGARASIPGKEYWPEGTASRVRAAGAPEPSGKSIGAPSYGKEPGSRRKKNKTSVAAPESSEVIVGFSDPGAFEDSDDLIENGPETLDDALEEPKDLSSEYVVYQKEPEEEETREYELNKKLGAPHPFIDPEKKKPIEEPLTSQELWWNWRKPYKEQWSRWQRRRPDVETVFLKAMAETGQVKLYGEHPTLTETSLYRARRHLFKEEKVQAEQERLQRTGPIAYYSEWVKAWKRDTSREAVQKHFEETGEDENTQLVEMFQHQTDREYRIMMGTDIRIPRDPLAMRMKEDQIKQIWGGDPVYPTVNYIQDPNEVIDYRGPDFHEPTPNLLAYLKEHGKIVSREEFEKVLSKEKTEEFEVPDMDEAMARAVDIGENDEEGEDSEVEADEEEEKITRNWSVLKSTPELRKSKKTLNDVSKGSKAMKDYETEIQDIVHQLRYASIPVYDEDVIIQSLEGLPPEYDHIASMIRTRSTPLTLEECFTLLRSEESHILHAQKTRASSFASQVVFYTQKPNGYRGNNGANGGNYRSNNGINGGNYRGNNGGYYNNSPHHNNGFNNKSHGNTGNFNGCHFVGGGNYWNRRNEDSFNSSFPRYNSGHIGNSAGPNSTANFGGQINNNNGSNPNSKYSNVTCQICKKMGHSAVVCFFRNANTPKKQAYVTSSEDWLFDSGANNHVTNDLYNLTIQEDCSTQGQHLFVGQDIQQDSVEGSFISRVFIFETR